MTPNQYDFVFFSPALIFGAAGGDGCGVGKSELEGDASFGDGNVFSGSFGSVVDLVGWGVDGVVARLCNG
eukprot:scaffold5770_cov57-Cyclotella_meneghiniana.AAC.1